jgi:hypothetical protein
MANTITETNGHRSQPSRRQDIRNKARKNHIITSRGDDGLKLPPPRMGIPVLIQSAIEAVSKIGFWFKVAAGPRFHAKPDDASILVFIGAP